MIKLSMRLVVASVCAFFLQVICLPAFAVTQVESLSDEQRRKMTEFVESIRRGFSIKSGMSVAIVQDKRVTYKQHFGYADIENEIAVTDDTVFYSASTTKPIFALAFLHAMQVKGFGLDTSLRTLFPNVAFSLEVKPEQVTVRHLLNHSSGLQDKYLQTAVAFTGIHDFSCRLAMLSELTVNSKAPLGSFEYTNLGYNILGIAYEKHFKQPWHHAVTNYVLSPLKMHRTSARVSQLELLGVSLARPYSFFSNNPDRALYLSKKDNTMHAAGGLVSTAEDMAKLLVAIMNNGGAGSKPLLGEAILQQTLQPSTSVKSKRGDFDRQSYGLGWYIGDYKSHQLYHHFGSFSGFRPHVSFIPQLKIGLVILNNEGPLNDKLTDLVADYAYSALLGEEDFEQRLAARVEKLKALAFGYQAKIQQKEASYDNSAFKLDLPLEKYAGIYHHPFGGTVNVAITKNKKMVLTWGNLHSMAQASPRQNEIRVKLDPISPQFIRFNVSDGQVKSLVADQIVFSRKE